MFDYQIPKKQQSILGSRGPIHGFGQVLVSVFSKQISEFLSFESQPEEMMGRRPFFHSVFEIKQFRQERQRKGNG